MKSLVERAERHRIHLAVAVLAATFAFCGTAASAQEQERDPLQVEDSNQARNQDRDRIVLGVGASFSPAYRGSDNNRIRPLPVIDVKKGRFYANLRNGLGLNLIESRNMTVGGGVTYIQGFRRSDVPDGVERLKLGVGVRGYATFRGAGFVATVGGTKGFTGGSTKGFLADASLAYPIPISPKWTLTPSISTAWADRKYNDDFYGVSASESIVSGLPVFRAGSGFRDASASLAAVYRLTDRITLSASGGVTTLLGDLKDSPLVFKKTQPTAFVGIGYRF